MCIRDRLQALAVTDMQNLIVAGAHAGCVVAVSYTHLDVYKRQEMHYAANAPRNIYSHTKSFTVTAVGLAIDEGKLSLEDHVAAVFKDKLPSHPDPNLAKIQLKHLLCMSSGFGKALLMNADRRPGIGAPDYELSLIHI